MISTELLLWAPYIIGALVLVNLILLWALMTSKRRKIKRLEKSPLAEKTKTVVNEFKKKITFDFLADGRIKIDFPEKFGGDDLYFYIGEEDGVILISDWGEVVSRMNLTHTMNRNAIHRACAKFCTEYNSETKVLYMISSLDSLDEDMWSFLYCLVTLEYARY